MWYSNVFAKRKEKQKTIVVDFDGTIAVDDYPGFGKPMPGVSQAFKKLKEAGFEIVVFSCRTGKYEHTAKESEVQREGVLAFLKENDIPFDRLDDGKDGKPHGLVYIDNKAVFYGGNNDWDRIAGKLLAGEGAKGLAEAA
jgi:hypothetical protein